MSPEEADCELRCWLARESAAWWESGRAAPAAVVGVAVCGVWILLCCVGVPAELSWLCAAAAAKAVLTGGGCGGSDLITGGGIGVTVG